MAIKTTNELKRQSSQKRSGQHHRQSKKYLKTYWPYLPLLAIIGLGLLANGFWSSHMRNIKGYSTQVSPSSLLAYTNQARTQNNEKGLTINPKLSAAAQAKANDMAKRNYWSHVTPDGKQPWQFITAEGYKYQSAGENLAYGFADSQDVLVAWMHSPEHRANILDRNYQNIGFGIVNIPNYQGNGPETLVVAMYGQPAAPVATTASTSLSGANTTPLHESPSQPITRVQLLSGGTSASVFVIVLVVSVAGLLLILRHGLAFKRLVAEGEEFVLHHRYLDVAVVSIIVIGALLIQVAGTIH